MSFQSDIIQLEAAVQTSVKEIKAAETQTAEVGFVTVSFLTVEENIFKF